MIGSRPKPNHHADQVIAEPTCFSFLSFFSKPKPPHKPNISEGHPHHSTSLGSDEPSNVTSIPLSEMDTQYLDIELDHGECLEDVCQQDDIIGVVGSRSLHENDLPLCGQLISISARSEVNGLDCLRAYCFDRVLILNQFSEYSLKELLKVEQILTIKLPSLELLLQAVNHWENLIVKDYQEELMNHIILKLTLKILIYGKDYYLTLNQNYRNTNYLQSYHWPNIGLNPNQHQTLIQRVLNQMTVKQFCEISDIKPKGDIKAMIEEMLEKKRVRKNSKISSSSIPSKKGLRKSSKDSSDMLLMDSLGEDSGEIVMLELPAQKKLRCYSADISDQALTSQQKDREKMLLQEIYLEFS